MFLQKVYAYHALRSLLFAVIWISCIIILYQHSTLFIIIILRNYRFLFKQTNLIISIAGLVILMAANFECWMGVRMQAGGRPTLTTEREGERGWMISE